MPPIDRRDFLKAAAALPLLSACGDSGLSALDGTDAPLPNTLAPTPLDPKLSFVHGVASGDPLADRVILWTRLSGTTAATTVLWRVFADVALSRLVSAGAFVTDAARDHTVKIDAPGLSPATTYYYQFEAGGQPSPAGRTRTLPVGRRDSLKLAVTTCGSYDGGLFNTYAAIARSDVAAVVHLGDYIYEGIGADTNQYERVHQPRKRTVTVDEYRIRYRQYRSDADLQALHAAHPMIAIWDDHEYANNAFTDGAEGHKAEEGDWTARKRAAAQAYHEWIPIRIHAGFRSQ